MPDHHKEKTLFHQLAQGDGAALAQIMDMYRPNIYTTALHMLKSAETAEEVVQDVFMIVWKKREDLHQVENFRAYLHGIARHTIYHALKNIIRQRERQLSGRQEELLLFHQDMEADMTRKEYQQILRRAVSRLPQKQQQAFILMKEEGVSREEAAARLQVSPETAKSNLEEAVRKVRAYCLRYLKIFF